MGNDFYTRRDKWEKQIENIVVEMSSEKTPDGFLTGVNTKPLIKAYNQAVEDIIRALDSTKRVIIPGNRKNEA